jgi:hypothetical protein
MMEVNSGAGGKGSFSVISQKSQDSISQLKKIAAKKKISFNAKQALRKVAMAETRQSLRGVISGLKQTARSAGNDAESRAIAEKVKKVLKKANEKMTKLDKEAAMKKAKEQAKKRLEHKVEHELQEALLRRKMNRRMREWDDVKNADMIDRVDESSVLSLSSAAMELCSSDTAAETADISSDAAGGVDIIV